MRSLRSTVFFKFEVLVSFIFLIIFPVRFITAIRKQKSKKMRMSPLRKKNDDLSFAFCNVTVSSAIQSTLQIRLVKQLSKSVLSKFLTLKLNDSPVENVNEPIMQISK